MALGVGAVIGSGIFIVSADITRNVGSAGWLLVVWLVTGLLTLMAALSYGELAAMMPGYVSYRQYVAPDGEGVAVVEFESHETVAAWRAHPEHREAQRLGRARWFTEYRITVCDSVRDYSFKA